MDQAQRQSGSKESQHLSSVFDVTIFHYHYYNLLQYQDTASTLNVDRHKISHQPACTVSVMVMGKEMVMRYGNIGYWLLKGRNFFWECKEGFRFRASYNKKTNKQVFYEG